MSDEKELYHRLKKAVVAGDLTAVKRLIKGGVTLDHEKAGFWYEGTLLHEAVAIGNEDIIKLLVQNKPLINAKDKSGQTALHLACRSGRGNIVAILLNHGASVNIITKSGRSPLHVASWQKHVMISTSLLHKGAAVNGKDEDGWTPLHWAARNNLQSLARLMIDVGAMVNVRDKIGLTPLHLVAKHHGTLAMFKILLEGGADPNIQTKSGNFLGEFIQSNHSSAASVEYLLQGGYCFHQDPFLYRDSLLTMLEKKKNDVYNIVIGHRQSLPSLSSLCRYRIRKRLNTLHGGRSLLRRVQELPLPDLLQQYIMLKNIKDDT